MSAHAMQEATVVDQPEARPMKVLVIDDNPADALFICQILKTSQGTPIEVEHVNRLLPGLEQVARRACDLVLLDLSLPESHGLDTFNQVHAAAPDLPIIVLSGLDDEAMATQAVRQGAQDYLVKSHVTPHLLLRALRYAIARQEQIASLRDLSQVDYLTGLYNRRGFFALAEGHLKVARRMRRGFVVVCADLDGLKGINDSYGHSEGDQAIVAAANVLRACFRQSDLVARFGGDEFAAVALEATDQTVRTLGERIRHHLGKVNRDNRMPFELSFSVGMSVFDPSSDVDLEGLLAQADQQLYLQKRRRGTEVKGRRPAAAGPRRG